MAVADDNREPLAILDPMLNMNIGNSTSSNANYYFNNGGKRSEGKVDIQAALYLLVADFAVSGKCHFSVLTREKIEQMDKSESNHTCGF